MGLRVSSGAVAQSPGTEDIRHTERSTAPGDPGRVWVSQLKARGAEERKNSSSKLPATLVGL
jgi:hypothetical protein